jgi:hypothetical protein
MNDAFTIHLTESEAVVLSSLLARLAERPDLEQLVPDTADRQALQNLIALLERIDPAAFASDYGDRLATARARVLREP